MSNRKPTATLRLTKDYLRLKDDPIPYIDAEPLPSNILEWHYVVRGPEDTPYYGGYYHGTLLFNWEFPFKPPAIYMITPNGRFQINTRLCLSISDFHPKTWNPAWSVSTILTGLLSFMLESTPTLGSLGSTDFVKQQLARNSLSFNIKNTVFCELFPDIRDEIVAKLDEIEKQAKLVSGTEPIKYNEWGWLDDPNNWQSIVSNIALICGFGAFALFVNFIVQNII